MPPVRAPLRIRLRRRRSTFPALLLAVLSGLAVGAAPSVAATGNLIVLGGTGVQGGGPDGPFLGTQIDLPAGLLALPGGDYLFTEHGGGTVRHVSADGQLSTFVGAPRTNAFSGDGGPARSATVSNASGLARMADGSILIADSSNHRVRKVLPNGTIMTVAGNGTAAYAGDGGPATAASLNYPWDVAATPDGGFLIADEYNQRIRKVGSDGLISTVAGTGVKGSAGDNGPATSAQLTYPTGVEMLPDGGYLIAEFGEGANGGRVRRVLPNGTITRVAGGGTTLGDGGLATSAALQNAVHVAVLPDGGFVIADGADHRVRRVTPGGLISTIAGTGVPGSAGLGGPAKDAQLNGPYDVAVRPTDGDILIAQYFGHVITAIDLGDPPPTPNPAPTAAPPTPTPAPRPANLLVNPVLSWDRLRSGRTRLRSLSVEGVVPGDAITLSCTGRCPNALRAPITTKVTTVKRGKVVLTKLVAGRTLSAGAKLQVRIARAGFADRIATYTIVRGKNPRKATACQAPGDTVAVAC